MDNSRLLFTAVRYSVVGFCGADLLSSLPLRPVAAAVAEEEEDEDGNVVMGVW